MDMLALFNHNSFPWNRISFHLPVPTLPRCLWPFIFLSYFFHFPFIFLSFACPNPSCVPLAFHFPFYFPFLFVFIFLSLSFHLLVPTLLLCASGLSFSFHCPFTFFLNLVLFCVYHWNPVGGHRTKLDIPSTTTRFPEIGYPFICLSQPFLSASGLSFFFPIPFIFLSFACPSPSSVPLAFHFPFYFPFLFVFIFLPLSFHFLVPTLPLCLWPFIFPSIFLSFACPRGVPWS